MKGREEERRDERRERAGFRHTKRDTRGKMNDVEGQNRRRRGAGNNRMVRRARRWGENQVKDINKNLTK